jgi:septum formation protein
MVQSRRLVLASTSRYRRQLLERLRLAFECVAPAVDETPLSGEAPARTASRLAELKASAAIPGHPDALIIGSDQVAVLGDYPLGKPGNYENALAQLRSASGRTVDFHTAICVIDARCGERRSRVVPCRVTFRKLTEAQMAAYLVREQPYDCAGSAKSEGLGIALIERIDTTDPTSLIGLPLIALSELLAESGMPVLG